MLRATDPAAPAGDPRDAEKEEGSVAVRRPYRDPRGSAYDLGWSFYRGEISRRSLLRRAAALSLSTPVVSALLAGARPAVALAQDQTPNPDLTGEISVISNTGAGAESQAWNDRIDAFEALYPNVTVKRDEKVGETYYTTSEAALRQIAGGVPPDTLRAGDYFAAQLASRGALLPLDDFIANDPTLDWEDFLPAARESFTYDGVVYALPENAETYGINYNRTAFQEAGLPDPREQWDAGAWTFEAFLEAAKALTTGEGVDKKYGFLWETWNAENWIFYGGGKILDDDLKTVLIDQPSAYEGLQFAADLTNVHGVAPQPLQYTAERGPIAQFQDGTGRMYMLGGWYIANFVNDITDFEYFTSGPPIGAGGKTSKVEISSYVILKDSPRPDIAWEFIKFITGPVGQRIWSVVATPTRQKSLDEFVASSPYKEYYKPFVEILPNARHSPFFEKSAEIAQIFTDGSAAIYLGDQTAEEATAAMAEQMRAVVGG
jgi:multiple sugar transport system substrate-binding protein